MIKIMDELSLFRLNVIFHYLKNKILIESLFESGSSDLTTNLMKALNIAPSINQVIYLNALGPKSEHFHYMKSCRGSIFFDVKYKQV